MPDNNRTVLVQSHSETASQRFVRFCKHVLLEHVNGPIAIFLDEIDSTLRFDFADDLFTALRFMYNSRSMAEEYQRLSFCLAGVATLNELIKDHRITPYNVGHELNLSDFDQRRDDLSKLVVALHPNSRIGISLLDRVLYWTSGHPYLTMYV